jgi:hypothetical protein
MPERKRQKRRGSTPRPEQIPGLHHVADEPVGEAGVEEQIRKEWDSKIKGGLSTSLRTGSR